MGKITLTDNVQGEYRQVKAIEDFETINIKKGDVGGYVDTLLMTCEPGNMNSWLDEKSLFEGLVLYGENIIENSTVKTHYLKNTKIKNSKILGFNCIENCMIENVVIDTSPYFSIKDAKILKNDDIKILEIDMDRMCAIYPHIETGEKVVFLGDLDNYLFEKKERIEEKLISSSRFLKIDYFLSDKDLKKVKKFILEN